MRLGATRIKRLAVFLTLAVVLAPGVAQASLRHRNKVAHFKHYTTCSTCPRAPEASTIDYGPDGKLNSRLWEAAAANPYSQYLFYVWERGRIYYRNGRCTSKPSWSDDYYIYKQTWNKYQFNDKSAVKSQGLGPPAWRYRRVMFHFYAGFKDWSWHKDKYVGMTLRCDGTWQPAG